MTKTNLTKAERETVITYNEADPRATVYTYSPRLTKRLRSIADEEPSACTFIRADGFGGETFTIDKRLLPLPRKPRKGMSEDQRAAAVARLTRKEA